MRGTPSIGIDFGTTNTVVAVADPGGNVETITFAHNETLNRLFNSALCFWEEMRGSSLDMQFVGGPWAVEKFMDASHPHRFIQSFKTYAASSAFQDTRIFRKRFEFEGLLSTFLDCLCRHVDTKLPYDTTRLVIGRPVQFAGSRPDDALAMRRYRKAFSHSGMTNAQYAYEPVGAAFYFARRLASDANVLVADFGGGTSDFSILRFAQHDGEMRAEPLGHAGIGVAGDAFDYRIIDHLVSPRLGKGSSYRSWDKLLTMPNRYYVNFARWSQLALMKSSGELKDLLELEKQAVEAGAIRSFIDIIENDLGFALYRAVTDAKIGLSSQMSTAFQFNHGNIEISATITRNEFEFWIAREIEAIASTVDQVLMKAQLQAAAIDKVFLTGGSSFIPAIRNLFVERFGEDRIQAGDEFESIAYGLALIGQDAHPENWLFE